MSILCCQKASRNIENLQDDLFINGFHHRVRFFGKDFSLAIIAFLSLFIVIKKKSQECVSFKQFSYFNLIPRRDENCSCCEMSKIRSHKSILFNLPER